MYNNEEIFKELEDLLKDLSIELKFGRGDFKGGICNYSL